MVVIKFGRISLEWRLTWLVVSMAQSLVVCLHDSSSEMWLNIMVGHCVEVEADHMAGKRKQIGEGARDHVYPSGCVSRDVLPPASPQGL